MRTGPDMLGVIVLPVVGLLGSFAVMGLFTALAWGTLPPEWQVASVQMFFDPGVLTTLDPLPERYVRVMMVAGWFPLSKALIVFSLCYQAALDQLNPSDPAPVEVNADFVRQIAEPPTTEEAPATDVTDIIEAYAEDPSRS
jgi:hypothetical protein